METMARERSHRPFDLERLTYALGGGEYDVQLKRRFMSVSTSPSRSPAPRGDSAPFSGDLFTPEMALLLPSALCDALRQLADAVRCGQEIERDPLFRLDDIHDLTKSQLRERTMAKFASMTHYVTNERLDVFTKRMELIGIGQQFRCQIRLIIPVAHIFRFSQPILLSGLDSVSTSTLLSFWTRSAVLTTSLCSADFSWERFDRERLRISSPTGSRRVSWDSLE